MRVLFLLLLRGNFCFIKCQKAAHKYEIAMQNLKKKASVAIIDLFIFLGVLSNVRGPLK